MLDDRQPEPGAAGRPRPRRVGPVEALEDALEVPLRDADALVADGDLHLAVAAAGADRHPGADRAVGHRVVDQVDQRRDQLGLAAAHGQPALAAGHHRDAGGLGGQPGPVHRLGHHVVHLDDRRRRQRLGALQPGQLDQLGDQPAEPVALVLHPLGEAADRLRVVGRALHRLGEQGQRAHRRLELVRDVRDEVAADRVQPTLLGHVVEHQRHVPALHQRRDLHAHRDRLPAEPAARRVDHRLPRLAVAPCRAGQPAQLVHHDPAAADDAHLPGGRVGQHHLVGRVEHHRRGAHHLEHPAGQRRLRNLRRAAGRLRGARRVPPVAPTADRERDQHADREADEKRSRHRHDVHTADRTVVPPSGRPGGRPAGAPAEEFTARTVAVHRDSRAPWPVGLGSVPAGGRKGTNGCARRSTASSTRSVARWSR